MRSMSEAGLSEPFAGIPSNQFLRHILDMKCLFSAFVGIPSIQFLRYIWI
jgi:hypothetical protein